ncbi:type II 3-dehydroquinate dehydratase [Maridesulfovibrio ferrireducens]|uniref:type II 3-dehydroquinate dehydratase n=1 Tax=Maridesulfovibrio ferrireducens TaxID=246191 RepID=UPI001A1A85A8|nr:type II 3-dehydroquinate dehydratase [Maridesulfovibrio ferrireducens]MBI9111468.1 3-dehydroquinate dehydratase [Maridesulfovibrio ferrireducens]
MYTFLILNGPNLGHVGKRQPEIYGSDKIEDIPDHLKKNMGKKAEQIKLEFFQANSEGALIDRLEKARKDKIDGIVFNAGAYTHTSLAIADSLAWIDVPCVEVHISNIWARTEDPVRQRSFMGKHCIGVIAGFGILSYVFAVQALFCHVTAD